MSTVPHTTDGSPVMHRVGTSPMVGRATERETVVSYLAQGPVLVWIDGEAGIGKSRLLQESLADSRLSALSEIVVSCPPFAQPWTLGPVIDALRVAVPDPAALTLSPVTGALGPLLPEWGHRLPEPPPPGEDASACRHQLFRAIAEVLDAAGVDLLAIEDLHWADATTVELLLYLASALPRGPRLVVTCRLEDLDADAPARALTRTASGAKGVAVSLHPLDAEATESLARSLLGDRKVTARQLARVTDQSDGVPFAVEEMVRLLVDAAHPTSATDDEDPSDRAADPGVPTTVRDTVLSRVAKLPLDAITVVRAAAVWGDRLTASTLASLTGIAPDLVATSIGAALDSGILAEPRPGWLGFRHALAAVAVYDAIPASDRRGLHAKAATLLQHTGSPPPTRIAEHYLHAGDTDQWRVWTERAADLALSIGDEATATRLLSRLVGDPGVAAQNLAGLMDKVPFSTLTDPAKSAHLLEILRGRLEAGHLSPGDEAAVRWQLGRVLTATDDFEAGQAELEAALQHLDRDSLPARRAMGVLATPFGSTRTRDEHLYWLNESLAQPLPEDWRQRLMVLVDQVSAMLLLDEGDGWTRAGLIPTESTHDRERVSIAFGSINVADQAMVRGRFALAEAELRRARGIVERHGYPNVAAALEVTQLHLDWYIGRWDAITDRAQALVASTVAPPLTKLESATVLALRTLATGSASDAERQLRAVLDAVPRRGAVWTWMEPAGALARLLLERQQPQEAVLVTDEPMAVVARKGAWYWASELSPPRVRALTLVGRLGDASDLTEACHASTVRGSAPSLEAAVHECRASIAEAKHEPERAIRLYERAADAWEAIPRPYEALLAREHHARCLLEVDAEQGQQQLLRVLRGFSRMGAARDATRVAQTLRGLGVAVRRPGAGRPGYGGRLSPRELEVVQLAAAGHTNKKIGEALSRSPRTVAGQLSAAMRKLDVTSRAALGRRLALLADDDARAFDDDAVID